MGARCHAATAHSGTMIRQRKSLAGPGPASGATGAPEGSVASSSSRLAPMLASELSVEDLLGAKVLGPDETVIGSVGDIALNDQGQVDAIIVDVGGFLGIGAKPVAVAMDNLQFMSDAAGRPTLTTLFTRDQLRAAPEYKKDEDATVQNGAQPSASSAATPVPAPQTAR